VPLASTACVLCTRPSKESRHQPQSQPLAASACKGRCTDRERGRGVMPPSAAHMSTPCCDVWGCCMGLGSGAQGTGAPLAAGCCMVREVVAHRRELRHTVKTTAGTGLNSMLVGQQRLACAAGCQHMGANVFATICPSWAVGKGFTGSYLAAVQLALVPTFGLCRCTWRIPGCCCACGLHRATVQRGRPTSMSAPAMPVGFLCQVLSLAGAESPLAEQRMQSMILGSCTCSCRSVVPGCIRVVCWRLGSAFNRWARLRGARRHGSSARRLHDACAGGGQQQTAAPVAHAAAHMPCRTP
jgi:hypothetical protein